MPMIRGKLELGESHADTDPYGAKPALPQFTVEYHYLFLDYIQNKINLISNKLNKTP